MTFNNEIQFTTKIRKIRKTINNLNYWKALKIKLTIKNI